MGKPIRRVVGFGLIEGISHFLMGESDNELQLAKVVLVHSNIFCESESLTESIE